MPLVPDMLQQMVKGATYFTEQHIHPLASSSHSSTSWPSWLTVKALSMSAAVQQVSLSLWCGVSPYLTVTEFYATMLAEIVTGWPECVQAVQNDSNLPPVLLGEYIIQQGGLPSAEIT